MKKHGSIRVIVDYRGLNKVTEKKVLPFSNIQQTLTGLTGAVKFTTLDLKQRYHQPPMHKDSKPLSSFVL